MKMSENKKIESKKSIKNKSPLTNAKSKHGNGTKYGTKNDTNVSEKKLKNTGTSSKSNEDISASTKSAPRTSKLSRKQRTNKIAILLRKIGKKFLMLGLMSGAVYLAMWFNSKELAKRSASNNDRADLRIFADADAFVQRRSMAVPCSQDYANERNKWDDCLPKRCGRVVMDSLISKEESEALLRIAQKGLALGGSNGGASILDLHSGALSKGDSMINIFRMPQAQNLFTPDDFIVFSQVKNKIQHRIAAEFGPMPQKLFLTHPTFFSRMTNKPAKTIHDEYWHPHVDKETYESFHYTSLLYLDTYSTNFTGGRFGFIDGGTNVTLIEPRAGRVSMFTSGSENLHFVEKVSSGERYALTIAFTCNNKSAIHDIAATAMSNQIHP